MQLQKDQVAVITGAAEGIGRAFAEYAAGLGMRLVLADINAERLAVTAAQLGERFGVAVISQRCDVAQLADLEALAEAAYRAFGQVNLLINNAGVALCKTAWDTTPEEWSWVLGVNLMGVVHGIRAFVPRMLEGGENAHIVNVASAAGLLSQPGFAAYNVSKHGVVTLSEGLFHDLNLRRANIGVSVLCPAWVKTRITDIQRYEDDSHVLDLKGMDKVAQRAAFEVQQAVEQGMAPERVAEATFNAVRDNRFYVLTHEPIKLAVQLRMQDIVEGKNPRLLPFQ